jgi:hypothetical protein
MVHVPAGKVRVILRSEKMDRLSLGSDSVATALEVSLRPKCIACGNTRVFYVVRGGEASLWQTMDPFPAPAKIAACGKCRSRHSLIMDYSD